MAKKKRLKKETKNNSRNLHISEIIGILLIAIAIFYAISLLTVDARDPSYFTETGRLKVNNWGGIIGSNLAHGSYQFFGYASLLLPFFIGAIGIRRFRIRADHRILKVICSILLFFETMIIVQLRWSISDPLGKGMTYKTGGVLGEVFSEYFVHHFNEFGSYIIVITAFIITILLFTGISIKVIFDKIRELFKQNGILFKEILKGFLGRILRRRQVKHDLEDDIFDERIIIKRKVSNENNRDESETKKKYSKKLKTKKGDNTLKKNKKVEDKKQFVQKEFEFLKEMKSLDEYVIPSVRLLDEPPPKEEVILKRELKENSIILKEKLHNFGVEGRITQVFPGPVITRYEYEPDPGIKLSKITGLADDLGLALKAKASPIVAPVPGKSVVGIEIPNIHREIITLKEIIVSEQYNRMSGKLKLAMGKDTSGVPYVTNLATMPHLLIAGATGAGKSVCVHSIVTSLLYSATPEELNIIMIDPKMLELSVYNDIPHLREPVVTNAKKAAKALHWAETEMENRYQLLSNNGVRNVDLYNKKMKQLVDEGKELPEGSIYPLPYIVIIIDELADLMMVAASDVEKSIARLAQMARAAGMHLIISTQRPSVNVLTGIIKANFPSRIAFQVSSKIDSRTILDVNGAERLLGKGDMLFKPPNTRLIRLHGAFVKEIEVQRIVQFASQFQKRKKEESIFQLVEKKEKKKSEKFDYDEKYDEAVRIIVNTGNASISMLQRRLHVGHSRAARLIDIMEQEGVVGPFEGSKSREVLWKPEDMPPLENG